MTVLTEDDVYRESTQYRLWSYTRASLASLRSTTNAVAAANVKAAIHELHARKAADGHDDDSKKAAEPPEVDCLTVEEERKLVEFYCIKAIEFVDFYGSMPTAVKATAVQYIKRFYLSNSPMTYHPKEIMPSAIFLACKTENHHTSLRTFASKLPKTTAEDIIAPEFLLTQGLRFTFDVRHPDRGLSGGYMELLALAKGDGEAGPSNNATSKDLQKKMLEIESIKAGGKKAKSSGELVGRVQIALGKAKETLKTSALLTDSYFLYTPSQIWLAALLMADAPLVRFYIDSKLPTASPMKPKLMETLQACADLMKSSPSASPTGEEQADLKRIDKKLYKCRNPEKIDLVSINKAQKRDGEGKTGNGLDEKIVKKRKLERENSAKNGADLFGPSL